MLKRTATEDDYKKRNFYQIGSLQRALTSPSTEQSIADQMLPLDLMNLSFDPAVAAASQYDSNSQASDSETPSIVKK